MFKIISKFKKGTDRLLDLRALKTSRQLTESEEVEERQLGRQVPLYGSVIGLGFCFVLLVGAMIGIGSVFMFGQYLYLPNGQVTRSGKVYEALRVAAERCSPSGTVPELRIVPYANPDFATAASAMMPNGGNPIVAVSKLVATRFSESALVGVFGHEFGYLVGNSTNGREADYYSVQCAGASAVRAALEETEKVLMSADFVDPLLRDGVSKADITRFQRSVQEAVSARLATLYSSL